MQGNTNHEIVIFGEFRTDRANRDVPYHASDMLKDSVFQTHLCQMERLFNAKF